MEISISEKLEKYKIHIIVTLGLSVVVSSLVLFVAPRFVTILSYFWPLLLSTALFLIAVVVFGRTTAVSSDLAGDKAGEGLLDYVAGEPRQHLHDDHDHGLVESSSSNTNNNNNDNDSD